MSAHDDTWEDVPLDQYEAPRVIGPGDDDEDTPVAGLWLPNPETRYGWELYRVTRTKPKQAPRPLGFYGKRGKQ